MTLIMTYQNSSTIVMLGDLLMSSSVNQAEAIDIPTRFDPKFPLTSRQFIGLTQKVICINPRLAIAWASRELIARSIISKIPTGIQEPYAPDKFLKFIDSLGYSEDEIDQVSFLFLFISGRDANAYQMGIQNFRTKIVVNPNDSREKFMFSGSGDFHFFETIGFNLETLGGAPDGRSRSIMSILARAVTAFTQELLSDDPHYYGYGGGFELVFLDAEGLTKLPFNFILWIRRGSTIHLAGPIFVQDYDRAGILYLHRFARDAGKWKKKTLPIKNFLNWKVAENIDNLKTIENPISAHLVFNEGDFSNYTAFLQKHERGKPTIRCCGDRFEINLTDEFQRQMAEAMLQP